MNNSDAIPVVEFHRGVGLHDQQTPERLAAVRQAIDLVFAEHDFGKLFEIAGDARRPPEARLFAAAKLQAAHEIAVQDRVKRPLIDLVLIQASVAGLNSLRWQHPVYFCSLLDPGPRPGEVWPKRGSGN